MKRIESGVYQLAEGVRVVRLDTVIWSDHHEREVTQVLWVVQWLTGDEYVEDGWTYDTRREAIEHWNWTRERNTP